MSYNSGSQTRGQGDKTSIKIISLKPRFSIITYFNNCFFFFKEKGSYCLENSGIIIEKVQKDI